MAIGKIIWFGGKTNIGRENNFGFISYEKENQTQEVYVNRKEVPGFLQKLFEQDRDRGKGIFVEFEIESDKRGEKASNLQLFQQIGVVMHSHIECEDSLEVFLSSNYGLHDYDIVKFGVRYDESRKRKRAIEIENVDPSELDNDTVKKYANNSSPRIFTPFLDTYFSLIGEREAIEFTVKVLQTLTPEETEHFVTKVKHFGEKLFILDKRLREVLANCCISQYATLINKHIQISLFGGPPEGNFLWSELLETLNTPQNRDTIWPLVPSLKHYLEYHGNLWDLAPIDYKKSVVKSHYSTFFTLVNEFELSQYAGEKFLSVDHGKLYDFNDKDKRLIEQWSPGLDRNAFEKARMISARGAEKLVKRFYKKMGNEIEDIAAHQVTGASQDWIKGDILVNSDTLFDVKNARKSLNSDTYSEFCIPRFKERSGSDVVIAAVLSPYLQAKYMDGTSSTGFSVNKPTYLGELTNRQLTKFTHTYSDDFIRLDMSRGFDPKSYLPPWLFDYNDDFYAHQLDASRQLNDLKNHEIPSFEDLEILEKENFCDYFPIFIFANRRLPKSWLEKMPAWMTSFTQLLYRSDGSRISLPHLYLSIFKHFLSQLINTSRDYHPEKYSQVFGRSSIPKPFSRYSSNPIKLYDPLSMIDDFCDTLETLWEHRKEAELTKFRIFKFNGRGLLVGKISASEMSSTTILAYCGGWIEGKGKCGYLPLVVGKEQNCPVCGKLICPKDDCGHCSNGCVGLEQRNQDKEPDYSNWSYSYN